jgi:pyruvate kinase
MRQTKIIATLGPASDSPAVLDDLMAAGVDVVRLNFSHGTHDSHRVVFDRVRQASARAGRPVAILQDLSGPKIRTGALEGKRPLHLAPGDGLAVATGDGVGGAGRVFTTFAGLAASVRPGDRLLLDDGRIELRVERTDGAEIATTVVFGGELGEHKGINAPGVALPASAVTPKDEDDLRLGMELGVDLVALSFVQSAADIECVRMLVGGGRGARVPVIAKIERPAAVDHIEGILSVSDAVMIARGDLGLELPLERVPRVQKQLTDRARALGLPVIVATQVLDSMRTEPRPTRAEVSDAAHAVGDGVDAIMLAGETAVGVAPARVVRTLGTIIEDAEAGGTPAGPVVQPRDGGPASVLALCEAAVTLARSGHAQAIVAVTRSGRTARLLAALRPEVPVHAVTGDAAVARRLSLWRGIRPSVEDIGDGLVPIAPIAARLVGSGALGAGSSVVLVSVDPDLTRPFTNFLRLVRLP